MESIGEPVAPLLGAVFALGACVGSFLNVVIHRVPRGQSIVKPRSRCPSCGWSIPGWANVPIVSWIVLRARCHGCGNPISARYPLVEAMTGAAFVLVAWRSLDSGVGPRVLAQWWLIASLIAATWIDAEHRIIPNGITVPGLVVGLGFAAFSLGSPSLGDAVLGVIVPGGLMWAISAFYEWRRGEIGLGMGDVKLVAMMGAFLGLEATFGVMVMGSLIGLVWAVFLIGFRGGDRRTRIPFGPALAAAGAFFLLAPPALVDHVYSWLRLV
jgi:leader peptidase (prepilin peptidase)/N-methyltransferase